ncbi:O-acyltransferase like protein [Cimex lectularius]|uniref:Nose resistant-to-fluoxetine protein N-terminal domain-containing protein n=1 Tax=Cimex lectularius TaxID=79782 RepID=A0A8I6RHD9_CIMLE|nr:O-acyltransferase like protein [Cimex lectularius]
MFLLYLLIPAALATVDFNATEVFHDDIPDNQDGAPSALPKKLFSFSPPFAPIDSSNEACRNESLTYLTNLYRFDLNAVMMYDATAKLPSGLLRGNVNQFGDFDLCLSAEGKYCLTYIDLKLAGTDFHALTEAHTLIHSHHAFRGTVKDPGHRVPRFSSIHWAVCVPKSCSTTDVEDSMSKVADDLSSGTGLKASVKVFPEMCQVASTEQVATSAWVVGTLFLVIIGFCFLATGADFFKLEETSIGMDLLICFSLKKNCKKLFSTEVAPDDISSVHGIRFLNAIMLYISHKSMALFYNPYMNRTIMAEALGKPWTVVARAASLYTDPFIMMSGLLTSHSLGKQYQRTKKIDVPREFLSRFMRLLPTLGALILFCTFILPYLGSGPQWPLVIEHHATLCKQYWWRNMLLIHNYFGFQNMCLTHTHHIGIDTQLFLVSPLLIYIVNKWPKQGLLTLLIIGVLSTLLRLYAVYYRQLNLYVYFGNSISQMFDTADYSYILPTHRATVYVMGIALGYVLRQWGRDVKLKNSQLALGWMLAICSLYQCVVQPSKMGDRFYVYDTTDAVMYAGFAPITWCLVFSWVIFTTHTGNGVSFITELSTWKGWQITTRLSYTFYLTQFPVFFYNVGRVRSTDYYSIQLLFDIKETACVVLASIALTLFIEMPFQNIRSVILKKPPAQLKNIEKKIE